MSKLALLGGEPVRKKEFPPWPIIDEEEKKAVTGVLEGGKLSTFAASPGKFFLGGEQIRAFEKEFADYHSVKYAIAVNSATAGLHCAAVACGLEGGKTAVTTPYSFTSTASSILMAGALSVFADVDLKTYCIDPSDIEKKIRDDTKVILPVHLLGQCVDMNRITEIAEDKGLYVIEDCAQSPGAKFNGKKAGTIGDIGVFSFQETKNMVTGEGGMVITNNEELAEKVRLLRNHGEAVVDKKRDYLSKILGWNYRMTELEAAIGRAQLKKLDKLNEERIKLANYLTKLLKDTSVLRVPYVDPRCEHVFHVYGMTYHGRVPKELFIKAMSAEGIPLTGGYPHPLYMNPIFQSQKVEGISYKEGICPNAELLCKEKAVWFFMLRSPATKEDIDDIYAAIVKVEKNMKDLEALK